MYRPDSSLVLRPSIGKHISHVQEKSAFFLEFIVLSCTFRKFSYASWKNIILILLNNFHTTFMSSRLSSDDT